MCLCATIRGCFFILHQVSRSQYSPLIIQPKYGRAQREAVKRNMSNVQRHRVKSWSSNPDPDPSTLHPLSILQISLLDSWLDVSHLKVCVVCLQADWNGLCLYHGEGWQHGCPCCPHSGRGDITDHHPMTVWTMSWWFLSLFLSACLALYPVSLILTSWAIAM